MEEIKRVYFGCIGRIHHANDYNFILSLSDISRHSFLPGQASFWKIMNINMLVVFLIISWWRQVQADILPNLIRLPTYQEFILGVEEISTSSCFSLCIDWLALFSVKFLLRWDKISFKSLKIAYVYS